MRIPAALFGIAKEVLRHVLRRPVVGIAAAARTPDGRWVLIRRGDTGGWALPGGTLEWGETLRTALARELAEETGGKVLELGRLIGVYSGPDRDARFHAVTVLVEARIELTGAAAENPLEILEVRAFSEAELPTELSYQMKDMLDDARAGRTVWE
ncbi:MAG TPA: NUDIX domain-containing protein [Polyangiaceae bacterium]|nr:NUDIX domain-containing protein [Polyangiaceae bacterium]